MNTTIQQKTNPTLARKYFEDKMAFTTGPVELNRMMQNEDTNVIDLRAAEDFAEGHIPGAKNLPEERWATMEGLDRDKLNVLYCYSQVCHLAPKAAIDFAANGYPVMELTGGFDGWKNQGLEVES